MKQQTTAERPSAGEMINLVEFAHLRWWEGSAPDDLRAHALSPDASGFLMPAQVSNGTWHLGLEWDEPRDVSRVVAAFVGEAPPDLEVQYWQRNWPTPAPERRAGARRGWIGRDDPWHGRWVTARAEATIEDRTCTFVLDPVDYPELRPWVTWEALEESEDYLASFRRTLKLRLVSGGSTQPVIRRLEVTSAGRWREGLLDIQLPLGDGTRDAAVSATNGYVVTTEHVDPTRIRCQVLYTGREAAVAEKTILSLRGASYAFSFLIADLEGGPIYIPDYGVFVAWADQGVTPDAFLRTVSAASPPIYNRVFGEPEHSLARAIAEIPPLDVVKQDSYMGIGRYLPLGLEGGRQEFAVRHNGEIFADKAQLKLAGRDAARLLWPGRQMRFRFGTGDPPDFREEGHRTHQSLMEGWLPVVISRWLDREISFEQTAFVTLLREPLPDSGDLRGDEDVVAMVRFVMRNTTHGPKRAHLWLAAAPQEALALHDDALVAEGRVVPDVAVARQWRVDAYRDPRLRCTVETGERGTLRVVPESTLPGVSHAVPTALLYSVDLAGGESHSLTLAIPFATPLDRTMWPEIKSLDFDHELAGVRGYWHRLVADGGLMEVPDQVLSDFHRAARVHVGITADRNPVNGLTVVPAATWSYGACGNEACWQISMLDQAGHHDQAEDYLETFIRTQGVHRPDGRFVSGDGALVAMDFDGGHPVMGGFAYNLDQGYIMECLADHYRYSGDGAWLERVTPSLIAACDFVIRERARTKQRDTHGDPVEPWGLLPAGHLEDNPEWRHWFAVNAHAYAGLQAIADVLAEVEHPSAERLRREAAEYREDIRTAARRAMVAAPVVRLLDGTYVPHVPTRTGIRGREGGWFREAAYGALHLLEGGVFGPKEQEMTWVLKDLEDNLFVSREWGRPVDLERHWFSHGGVTIQPNLMDLSLDYLRRGEVKHALRALFNNFGASLYADVRTFTEHPVVELGHGVGPFYKSSDESKALIWLRQCLLHEADNVLHLALGAPRAWFAPGQSFGVRDMATHFGSVTYRTESTLNRLQVTVTRAAEHTRADLLKELIIHLRRPGSPLPRQVRVDGIEQPLPATGSETVSIPTPGHRLMVEVAY